MFEWDEAKSERNQIERGFDFALAARIFDGDTIEREETGRDYGEQRLVAIGQGGGITLTVVYTERDGARRIIPARRANKGERRVYGQAIGG